MKEFNQDSWKAFLANELDNLGELLNESKDKPISNMQIAWQAPKHIPGTKLYGDMVEISSCGNNAILER